MKDNVCVGGDCAAECPIFNLGGYCMTPAEMGAYFREQKSLALVEALVD